MKKAMTIAGGILGGTLILSGLGFYCSYKRTLAKAERWVQEIVAMDTISMDLAPDVADALWRYEGVYKTAEEVRTEIFRKLSTGEVRWLSPDVAEVVVVYGGFRIPVLVKRTNTKLELKKMKTVVGYYDIMKVPNIPDKFFGRDLKVNLWIPVQIHWKEGKKNAY